MARDWLAIQVELRSGRAEVFDPPPGRVLLVGPRHTFEQLADAINLSFARWDLAHLHEFELPDGRRVGWIDDESDREIVDHAQLGVATTLGEGDEFDYVFDLGDDWRHRCHVLAMRVDPRDEVGTLPRKPVAVWGWGWIPDQYGREDNEEGWEPQPLD